MSNLATKNFFFPEEIKEQLLVKKMVSSGMTVFDIGANIGNYTILFSQLVGHSGRVFSFEPTSSTFKKLLKRIKEYNCTNILAFQKAIFSENKQITFNEFPEEYSSWNSIGQPQMIDPENYTQYVPIINTEIVEAIILDDFCQQHKIETIDYLKIDVEGSESDVLKGASRLLSKKAIPFIQFEISQKMLEGLTRKAKDTFDILIDNGYEVHHIQRDGKIGHLAIDSESFYENYVAFPLSALNQNIKPIYSCLDRYGKEPTSQVLINNLQQARQQFAEQLLDLPTEQLASTYLADLGKMYQGLLNSGIKEEPLTDAEQAFVQEIVDKLVKLNPGQQDGKRLLEQVK